jgi:hypothetical protein
VREYLAQLRKRALHLRTTQALQSRAKTDEEIEKRAEAEDEDVERLSDQLTDMTKVFGRYLGFAHIARRRRLPSQRKGGRGKKAK